MRWALVPPAEEKVRGGKKQAKAFGGRALVPASDATAADPLRQAAAEGLELERSDSATGFKCVFPSGTSGSRFYAQSGHSRSGEHANYLGTFDSAEAAALSYARFRRQQGHAPFAPPSALVEETASEATQSIPTHLADGHTRVAGAPACKFFAGTERLGDDGRSRDSTPRPCCCLLQACFLLVLPRACAVTACLHVILPSRLCRPPLVRGGAAAWVHL